MVIDAGCPGERRRSRDTRHRQPLALRRSGTIADMQEVPSRGQPGLAPDGAPNPSRSSETGRRNPCHDAGNDLVAVRSQVNRSAKAEKRRYRAQVQQAPFVARRRIECFLFPRNAEALFFLRRFQDAIRGSRQRSFVCFERSRRRERPPAFDGEARMFRQRLAAAGQRSSCEAAARNAGAQAAMPSGTRIP